MRKDSVGLATNIDTVGGRAMGIRRGFIDHDGRVLRWLEESERLALGVAGLYVAKRFTCLIARNHGRPEFLGSGTLVRVHERVYVATAKHLFAGLSSSELIAVYWNEKDHRAGVARSRILEGDGDLDLAALPLDIEESEVGLALDAIAHPRTFEQHELFFISGIPAQSFVCNEACRTVAPGHWSLGLVALPQRSWPVPEPLNLNPDKDILFNYSEQFALDQYGEPMKPLAPFGLSGAGVWQLPLSPDRVWAPQQARLAAVQRSVESGKWRWLRATRIQPWLEMVRSP